jgi:UDP-glucose 6-dehydrogenase
MKTNIIMIISRTILLGMKNMFQTTVVDTIETHFLFNKFFFRKSCLLKDNVENYCIVVLATDVNMAHMHCMLDILGYKNTLRKCIIYCSSIVRMVAQKCLQVTLYVHCLYCGLWLNIVE